ncbi:pyridoxal 5'-phosphate synthase glutaminase subunit PdxT [Stomatohabitans albus]|uniref:pyridoxal 5'-phosphate synthase glutaminase subunit PdxT n=1 Tax=Stomatohabitans albus TaxID=3110766 RepID=UPI00300C4623
MKSPHRCALPSVVGNAKPRVGVLALQGAVVEHLHLLDTLGVTGTKIRQPEELAGLHGLIIPGGESTTIGKLADRWGLTDAIREAVATGMGVYGTCAGAILAGRSTVLADGTPSDQTTFGLIDIDTRRNAFGRQIASAEVDLDVQGLDEPMHAVFIRAPAITRLGPSVTNLANYSGTCVIAESDNILVSSFHPELTEDLRLHTYFLNKL